MLYFSRGSFGFSVDVTVCAEAVVSEAIQVRQMSTFVVEAVKDLMVIEAMRVGALTDKRFATPKSGIPNRRAGRFS